MDPEEQNQDTSDIVEEHSSEEQEIETESQDQPTGYNPVFEPIRQTLGIQFESILPDLKEIEKGFNSGITKANSKYEPWKVFADQGITPQQVTEGFGLLQQINNEPEKIYAALGEFLKQNGRLPQTDAEIQEVAEGADDEDLSDTDKQLAQLKSQFEQQQQILAAQQEQFQMEQLRAKASQDVDREYTSFEQAHPELSEDDKKWIYQQHFNYAAQGPQNIRSLEQVFEEYNGLVSRIRSAPRPNDSAPRLPGSGGGVPTGQKKRMDELSREESQQALAELLQSNR